MISTKTFFSIRKFGFICWVAGILLICSFPLFRPEVYFMHVLGLLFMYIALTESWNIIGGYTGYLSFGHVTFFGIGAYTSAYLLTEHGISPFFTAPLGGLLACLLSVIIGYPALRLRGPYFAIVTLSIALLAQVICANVTQVGGGFGITMRGLQLGMHESEAVFYWIYLFIAMCAVCFIYKLEKSRFGLALLAIRDDEDVASVFGVDVFKKKLTAFVLSTFLPGILGGIYAYQASYIESTSVFSIGLSIEILIMTMVGGAGTWLGPILGAVVVYLLSQSLSIIISSELGRVAFGVILIAVIYMMPRGLLGLIRRSDSPRFVKDRQKLFGSHVAD